jgi:hopanoid C-3 methylase
MPGTEIWPDYKDKVTIPREAHGLWDLSHVLLPTKMPLKDYYRALLKLYAKTILNLSRAKKNTQRTLPSIWSWKYFRMLYGSLKIGKQFMQAHQHHSPKELVKAMYRGPEVPGLTYKPRSKKSVKTQLKQRAHTIA